MTIEELNKIKKEHEELVMVRKVVKALKNTVLTKRYLLYVQAASVFAHSARS